MSEISELHNDQPGKKRLSVDYWQSHFREKENSGLSQTEYCQRHGIKYDAFQYWKQKLCKPKSESSLTFVQVRNEAGDGAVAGLNFKSSIINPSCPQLPPPWSIRFWAGGYCIEVSNNFSAACLVELIRTLEALSNLGKLGSI
ncbi:MAG: hypothetical protein NT166_30965 [Candidatus Aminicenantes bacterium]|nr:hypothetical protein [Candidatus Aminicenantes bacterium]